MKIGFIGLGIMGRPMATNLIKGGHKLFVFDRNPESVQKLVEAGATGVSSAAEASVGVDIVVTMLSRWFAESAACCLLHNRV